MRIPKSWLSVQDLFATNRSRTRKRRGTNYSPDVRVRSQIETEALEQRLLLSSTNDPVFPDGLGHADPVVRAAIQNVTTTGSQEPIYSLGGDFAPSSNASGPLINVDDFRNDPRFAGIDGRGHATVILDTGIDLDHPFFGPDDDSDGISDRIVFSFDFADNDPDASDVNGHGSNVSSIVASSDGTFTGMAPGADVIHLKVFPTSGSGSFSFLEDALQWVVANADTFNIASINMSLSDSGNHASAFSGFGIGDELAALAAMDVIVVSASGNSFFGFSSVQGVGYPAADPNSISVGAVWDSNVGPVSWGSGASDFSTAPGRITSFSQRHETLSTIFAPGAFITGAGPTGGLVTQGGTSQAAPHIAGIAVLAQQLAEQTLGRELTFDEFTNVMVASASIINDGDDEDDNVANTNLDFPLVDVFALGEAILAMAPAISITAADADKNEGSGSNTSFTFDVTRTGDLSILSTVEYIVTGSGTDAADADDFGGTFPSGVISFAANEASRTITIDVSGDTEFEPDETFTVTLANPTLAQLGTAAAAGTIRNDDAVGDAIFVSFADLFVIESAGVGATTGTVTRAGDMTSELLVALANGDDSEIQIPSSVTIAAGQASATFDVDAIDDFIVDGTQVVTVTATATGVSDATGSLNVRDNEVNPFIRVLPLGGLVAESLTTSTLLHGSDHREFDLFLDEGETLTVIASPASNEQLTVELVSLSAAQTSPAVGEPAIITPQLVPSAGFYRILVSGTGTTDFELQLLRNAATEQQVGEAGEGAELAIDNSLLALGRYAVVGESIPVDTGVANFVQSSNAAAFIDISASGTPLNLIDDGTADITTTIGNDIFGAGAVTVSNNGGILSGTGVFLDFTNTSIPTAAFNQALLPFWDDIDAGTGNVFWQERQVDGIDTLIVQWDDRPHFSNIGSATFQLQLFASGSTRVRYAYRDVDFGDIAFDSGVSATVGFQRNSTSAEEFSFNQAVLTNNDVVDWVLEPPKDVDEYTIDFSGKVGSPVDIVLAGRDGADYSSQTLELLAPDGASVLATGVIDPVQSGTASTGYDLGILNFVVPANGVYTVRVTSEISGKYSVVATDSLTFNSEADTATDPLRSLNANQQGLGFVDAISDVSDNYSIRVPAGMRAVVSTRTLFDSVNGSPLNSLNPEISLIDSTGAVLATDLDSATDGKNAFVVFDSKVTGTYRIQVTATEGAGDYILSVTQTLTPALTVDLAADSVVENDGAQASTVTITRNSDTTVPLDVELFISDASEASIAPVVTIPAGETSVTIDLAAIDDGILDGTQSVTITATAFDHEEGLSTFLVLDDEVALVTLSATNGSEVGPVNIEFTLTLDIANDTGAPITFDFADLGTGTATSGLDYSAIPVNTRFTIAEGGTSDRFTVTVDDDELLELTETLVAGISRPSHSGVTFASTSVTATIEDNDSATASFAVFSSGGEVVNTNVVYEVTLSRQNGTGGPVTFDFDVLAIGTATSGLDFEAVPENAVISVAAGAFTGRYSIPLIDDALLESTETVTTAISNASHSAVSITNSEATGTINDNESAVADLAVTTHGAEAGPVDVVFTVSLSLDNNTDADITFDFADLASGTATSGMDYTAVPAGTIVTVPIGSRTGSVTIPVIDDSLLESVETVGGEISSSSSPKVTINQATAVANISSDDTATAGLFVTTNGSEVGPVDIVYTITLDKINDTDSPITFDFSDAGSGTATPDSDYTAIPADTVLNIPIGSNVATYTVGVVNDELLEDVETMAAVIANFSNSRVSIAAASATATISGDETSIANLTVTTHGSEAGPNSIVYTVSLDKPNDSGSPITFDLADLATGSATRSLDYTGLDPNSRITIRRGESTGSAAIAIIDDMLLESMETVVLGISNSSLAAVSIGNASATGNISDNDTAIANLAVTTNGLESGPLGITYSVTLDRPNNTGLPIVFDLTDAATGTATSTGDYAAVPVGAFISVAPGATTATATIAVIDDDLLESVETVVVDISNSSNAAVAIGTGSATATIGSDDTATASLSVTSDGSEAGPADVVFTVTLDKTNNTDAAITFDLDELTTGTALTGIDYSSIADDAVFTVAIGSATASITVAVTNDDLLESTESINAEVSNSSNSDVSITSSTATAFVFDDETAVANLSVTSQGAEEGPVDVVYTVTLDRPNNTDSAITFDFDDLVRGSAVSGVDYTAIPADAVLSVAVGATEASWHIPVTDDGLLESLESLVAEISNSSNSAVTIVNAAEIAEITDNETAIANLSILNHGAEDGSVDITMMVSLSEINNTGRDISFDLDDLLTGTAVADLDYTAVAADASVVIPHGSDVGSLTITVLDDGLLEVSETVNLQLSNPSFGSVLLGTTSITANIVSDETAVANLSIAAHGTEAASTAIEFTVVLDLINNTGSDITIDLADVGTGTATAGIDYPSIAAGSQFTIPDGSDSATLIVPVIDDAILESTETMIAEITSSSSSLVSLGNVSAIATITDNETATADLTATTTGNEDGLVSVVFTVTLDKINNTDAAITFDLADSDTGTALSGLDYKSLPSTTQLVIPIGSDLAFMTVEVLDDVMVEVTETVVTTLSNSSNPAVSVGAASAVGNILSNDIAGFATTETVGNTFVTEAGSTDTFAIVLTTQPQSDVVFHVVSQDLTETTVSPATITFTTQNWNIHQTVIVTGVDDTAPDGGQDTLVSISVDSGLSDPLFASVGSQFVNVLTSDDEPGRLDVDADSTPNATTDGILIVRYLFGFRNDALIQDAIGNSASNTTAASIVAALAAAPEMLDVDGNGTADATTDGILIVRYLFGFRGDALVENAIATGAIRTTGLEVKTYLDGFMPATGGGFGSNGAGGLGGSGTGGAEGSGNGGRSAGGSAGAGSKGSSSPDTNTDGTIDISVATTDSGELVATWNNVSAADVYRVFILPLDGNGFVRRIDTADTQSDDLKLPTGSYRMWVEAIKLNSGTIVASGSVEFQVAANDAAAAGISELTSLQFAIVQMASATDVSETKSPSSTSPTYHVQTEDRQAEGPEVAPQHDLVTATVFNQAQDYLNSDSLMEAWMAEGLWID